MTMLKTEIKNIDTPLGKVQIKLCDLKDEKRIYPEYNRGFTDCLENPKEKGIIYGVGAWKVGEIKETPAMDEAYKMGQEV